MAFNSTGQYMKEKWEAEIWEDYKTDKVHIKVRQNCIGPDGQKYKRGVIFVLTDEVLFNIAEGMEYPQKSLNDVKWERIFEKA
jgi:hypothetical protein